MSDLFPGVESGECWESGVNFDLTKPNETTKSMCGACEVSSACRAYARRNERHGIWGGETEEDRIAVRVLMGIPTPKLRTAEPFLKRLEGDNKAIQHVMDSRRWRMKQSIKRKLVDA